MIVTKMHKERLHVISNIPVTKKSTNDEIILSKPPPPTSNVSEFQNPKHYTICTGQSVWISLHAIGHQVLGLAFMVDKLNNSQFNVNTLICLTLHCYH